MVNSYLQGLKLSASQFLHIFHHYDNDGSGFLKGKELQSFKLELQEARKQAGMELTDQMRSFMEEYVDIEDSKVGIVELLHILPTEENCLLFFRHQLKSCKDQENFLLRFQGVKMPRREFNNIFEFYDQDDRGYMDETELDALLTDLCEKNHMVLEQGDIPLYRASIMALSDAGSLYREERALVLCAEE